MSHTLSFLNRLTLTVVYLSTSALAASAHGPQTSTPRELPPGRTLEREMAGAENHRYNIKVNKDEFFQVRVEQKGIDVSLKLSGANGDVLATMDSPNGTQGPEILSFVADKRDSLTLEVRGLDAKAGKGNYSIRRGAARAATARDRRRVEVERLFVAGSAAQGAPGQSEAAIKQLTQARAGWEELADGYMADLTARLIYWAQQIPPDISAVIQELNKELTAANDALAEGQKLAVKSKADSLPARTKTNEALALFRAVRSKASDKALAEKVNQSGHTAPRASNLLKAIQFFTMSGEGTSLNAIAQTHYNLGEMREHIDYVNRSLASYQEAARFLTDAGITGLNQKQNLFFLRMAEVGAYGNLAGAYNRLGKPGEALKYGNLQLDLLRALQQESPNPQFKLREALALQQIGLIHSETSRDRKAAIEYVSKAVEIYRAFPDQRSRVASLLGLIGSRHSAEFNFEAALKYWNEALAIYQELDDKTGQTGILQSKGTMYFLLDDKTKVRENFGQALSILQSPGYTEDFQKNLFGKADSGFEVYDELGADMAEYFTQDRIGFAYEMLEDYAKAVEHYEKALAVARARKETLYIRSGLASVGFAYGRMEKWDRAHEYYRQALEISRGANVREVTADDLAHVGWTLLGLGRPQDALRHLNESLALFQSAGVGLQKAFTPRYSPMLNDLGRAHHALGNRRLAIFYGKQAVNAFQDERQRLRNFDAQSQRGFLGKKEKHYRRLADWLIADGRIPEAEQVLAMLKEEEILSYVRRDASEADKLQQRSDLSAEERDALTRYNKIGERIAAVGAEYDELRQLRQRGATLNVEQQARYDELAKQVADANNIFQAFLKQLESEFGKRGLTKRGLEEELALQSQLKDWGEGVVFLYTLVGEDRYRVILTTPKVKTDGKHEIKSADLDRKISDFRQIVQDPARDPRPLGKELYDILIGPVERQLEGARAKTLLWSLDGNLRLLPLAALWDGRQYFGQKYQNVIFTPASRSRLNETDSPNWRVLGAGVSEPRTVSLRELDGASRSVPFSELPAVKTELAKIVADGNGGAGVLPGSVLLNADFNRKNFTDHLLKGYKAIHIASHFALNAGDASQSFLLLGDGSALPVSEIKTDPGVDFAGVDLLTLSACQTAVVEKDSNGKEVEGFGYVAQQKGAKAILATLWSVTDESTSLLMGEFYRLRKERPQLTKAAALQSAQRQMIEGKLRASAPAGAQGGLAPALSGPARDAKRLYSHPYYWSPFILIGNWR